MNYYFSVKMSYVEFLPYYQNQVNQIVVTTTEGVRVQFPAVNIKPYLTRAGISGMFCMKTENNKFVSLTKIGA